jgi:hypothetical protein
MTAYIEVLTEGASDVPVIEQMLTRHFGLQQGEFRIHPHKGKGRLPANPLAQPERQCQGLLDQLPAKLRGMSWLPENALVLVLIDADDDDCLQLLTSLQTMFHLLPKKPARVMFRLAIEETESWFLADTQALKAGIPRAKLNKVKDIVPDAVVGAWEVLADAIGVSRQTVTGIEKLAWAKAIAPHMNFADPRSPSLRELIDGTRLYLEAVQP